MATCPLDNSQAQGALFFSVKHSPMLVAILIAATSLSMGVGRASSSNAIQKQNCIRYLHSLVCM
ncbi:hypothetical protein CC80DRAFT_314647 [Byssothecium circinans]|uniref:Uncharacterized protein n=1 Tax=Byssothecium circinans TaxID=147558 RepID=A0A6A5T7A8_9PLEO|nr:hypothetical protein CC80DRAFT_314647 [Byssothecium circinans]